MVTIKTPELHHWRRSGLFIGNFEHISYFFLVFLLLTLNKQMLGESVVTFKYIKETINLLFFIGKWEHAFALCLNVNYSVTLE